jgi:hypothetical protein
MTDRTNSFYETITHYYRGTVTAIDDIMAEFQPGDYAEIEWNHNGPSTKDKAFMRFMVQRYGCKVGTYVNHTYLTYSPECDKPHDFTVLDDITPDYLNSTEEQTQPSLLSQIWFMIWAFIGF